MKRLLLHASTTVVSCSFLLTSILSAQSVNTPKQKAPTPKYPWKTNITATIFWVGEKPTKNNPTPNHASSWDTKWQINFGGYDDPNDRAKTDYRPAKFIPKRNPFYIALPYNDRVNHKYIKREAPHVIPWYDAKLVQKGKSACHNRWVQIVYGKKYCYAQWKDCGPFVTDDYQYVFGNQRPKNSKNNGAGIDLSPAIRDYLKLQSGAKVHWRFVEASQIPDGPWGKYGELNCVLIAKKKKANSNELQEELNRLYELREKARLQKKF